MPYSRKDDPVAYAQLATGHVRGLYAERMKFLREIHGESQQTCADALGIGQPAYWQMENNEQRIRRRDLVTLAHHYGLTLEEAFPVDLAAAGVLAVPPSMRGRLRAVGA